MDGKLNYLRFRLCKKPDKKTPNRREITLQTSEGQKNRKYKSHNSLIGMD